jgi:hypothetical protein
MEKFEVRGFKYLFNAIDMSSRCVYSQALKNKTDTEVLKAFKQIYKQSQIRAIQSDNGSEFINKKFVDFLNKNGIKQILSEAEKPQSNGECNDKELIQKSIKLDKKMIGLNNIKNSQHRITKFTPNQIQQAYENDDTII